MRDDYLKLVIATAELKSKRKEERRLRRERFRSGQANYFDVNSLVEDRKLEAQILIDDDPEDLEKIVEMAEESQSSS